MERAGLKILNTAASPLHFRAKTSIFRPFFLPKVVHNLHFPLLASSSLLSPLHSLCIRSDANTLPNGDEGPTAQNKLLQVVLVSPQIPGNTGSIARTCAASAVGLHLVEPLGFPIDNTKLKRAGLDYWPYPFSSSVVVKNSYTLWSSEHVPVQYMLLSKCIVPGMNSGSTSWDRLGKKGCWHSQREEQIHIQTSPTKRAIGLYLDQKLKVYPLKPCLIARVNLLEEEPYGFPWLKHMLGA